MTRSLLEDPEIVDQFVELYVAGATHQTIADTFGVDRKTIQNWLKRPEIQAIISELRQRRVNRMTRKIDAMLEAKIDDPNAAKNLDVETLLKIRRELVPQKVEVGRAGEFEREAEAQAWAALDAGEKLAELPAGEEIEDAEVVDE